MLFEVCKPVYRNLKSYWDSDLIKYYCAQDDGIEASGDYMLVIVVISVSFRESTLLRLETETVTSLALDLEKV